MVKKFKPRLTGGSRAGIKALRTIKIDNGQTMYNEQCIMNNEQLLLIIHCYLFTVIC